ncbi:MAG TPA: peptidoglycan DD-metalloendopeptidase family protein [Pyrinomonadaceae bacterium]|nr:peptidoglycan DD-metalloendopeptidase family protein [Pyrinomonadaceae bacterium]
MITRSRLLVAIVIGLAALCALIWILSRRPRPGTLTAVATSTEAHATTPPIMLQTPATSSSPTAEQSTSPLPQASVTPQASSPQPSTTAQSSTTPPTSSAQLLIPVAGVRPEQLRDTFTEARSEGRTHDAIDIPAPRGTPVLAAADGRIVKLFQSKPGGTTIYQLDPDNRTVYYYAHLDHYAEGITEGHFARRGEVIAYVGDTGNAGAGNYHLHFSILIVSDPKRYWEGVNINPYPLLRGQR